MTRTEARAKAITALCTRDPRSPHYIGEVLGEEPPAPRIDCACDCCFCGRDELAVAILELLDMINSVHLGSPSADD